MASAIPGVNVKVARGEFYAAARLNPEISDPLLQLFRHYGVHWEDSSWLYEDVIRRERSSARRGVTEGGNPYKRPVAACMAYDLV